MTQEQTIVALNKVALSHGLGLVPHPKSPNGTLIVFIVKAEAVNGRWQPKIVGDFIIEADGDWAVSVGGTSSEFFEQCRAATSGA